MKEQGKVGFGKDGCPVGAVTRSAKSQVRPSLGGQQVTPGRSQLQLIAHFFIIKKVLLYLLTPCLYPKGCAVPYN